MVAAGLDSRKERATAGGWQRPRASKCQHDSGCHACCMHGMGRCNYSSSAPTVAMLSAASRSRVKRMAHSMFSGASKPQSLAPDFRVSRLLHCIQTTAHLLLLLTEALHDAGRQLRQQHQQHQVAPGCGVVASQQQAERDVLQPAQPSACTRASCITVACCWHSRSCCCGSHSAGSW